MHAVHLLYAGVCLIISAAVIFGLWIRRKRRDQADQNGRDEQIRLSIIQTDTHAVHEQTQKFEEAMLRKPRKPKKRKRQKTIQNVKKSSTKRTRIPTRA
jgi:hypothetical protein